MALGRPAVTTVRLEIGDLVLTVEAGDPFVVPTETLADGPYTLRVSAAAGSGTGSLAETCEREQVEAVVSRPAVVDNTHPEAVAVRSVGPENGVAVVRWERASRFNFREYRVYRFASDRTWDRALVGTVEDRNVTELAAPTFVGGDVGYVVDVVGADGRVARGGEFAQPYAAPSFVRAQGTPRGEFAVAWSATPFPAAPIGMS